VIWDGSPFFLFSFLFLSFSSPGLHSVFFFLFPPSEGCDAALWTKSIKFPVASFFLFFPPLESLRFGDAHSFLLFFLLSIMCFAGA